MHAVHTSTLFQHNGSKASDCCLFVVVRRLATDNTRSSPDFFLYLVNVIARYWYFVVSIRRVVSSQLHTTKSKQSNACSTAFGVLLSPTKIKKLQHSVGSS